MVNNQSNDITGDQESDSGLSTPQQMPARTEHGNPLDPQLSPPAQEKKVKRQTPEEARAELDRAIQGTEAVLVEIKTALLLLPITLTLDRAKISAAKHFPGGNSGLMSLPMADVLNVTADVGWIFGHVKIDKRILSKEEAFTFGPFWRKDALRFATMSQGYIMALQRSIDLNALEASELRGKLFELGKDENINYSGAEPQGHKSN